MRTYAEKYGKDGLLIIAINLSDNPQKVYEFLVQRQVNPAQVPVLLGGANVERAFGVSGPHNTFLIDQRGIIRAHQQGALGNDRRFEQKIEMVLGTLPPEFGWRRTVQAAYQRAVEDLAANRLDQALSGLKSIAPASTIYVKVETSSLPPQYVKDCLRAVQLGVGEWQKILNKWVQFQLLTDEEKKEEDKEKEKDKKPEDKRADVVLRFMTQVFDPNDNTGLGTVCATARVMNEGRDDRKPNHTLAQIAVGHASTGTSHNLRAVIHLVEMSVGYALGLDMRDDPTSVMTVNVDDNNVTISPSGEDLLILSNLLVNTHLQMGNVYLKQKKFKEAEEEFKIVLAVNSREPRAAEGLKQVKQQQNEP